METIIFGNIRVQLLSDRIVRVEYGKNGKFHDDDTFFIPNKSDYAKTTIKHTIEENVICFGEYELYLPENAKSLSGVRLDKNGKRVYSYKKLLNCGELPPLGKTPDVFALSDTPRITVPKGGYSVKRNGEYKIKENVQDVYLLICNGDARTLRKLYVELTGRNEMVRLSTLGGWNSKYYAYTQEEAKQLILDYEKHDVPLDNMVIDTDWRSCDNGWGYDINTKLFPDMKGFLDFAHSHGVEIMFNDHPEPQNGNHVFAPREIEYRESNLQALMKMGVDVWWYDRNWFTHLISPSENVYWETFGLYLFEDITRHYWQDAANDNEVYRRPVIMGNVVNVKNGSYKGITDTASHRYSIQWTGDILCGADSLSQEVDNLVRCGNNGIAYVNSDCGGHIGDPDKELFIRWMQFGTLSPVFRPHCTNSVQRFREPWLYDEQTLDIVREYNNLRYRLLPIIYKNAYNNYLTGEPIFKAVGFEYQSDKKATALTDEYMLGNNILIAPIGGRRLTVVDKSNFVGAVKATYYDGRELKGAPLANAEYQNLNIELDNTPPEKGVPMYNFSARFTATVKFKEAVQLFLKSDDGATVWVDGEKVIEDKTCHAALMLPLNIITPNVEHKIEIEYFQAEGEACCGLYATKQTDSTYKEVYLPNGKWLDAFGGKVLNGGKTVKRQYGIVEMPLFVRLGAVLPLAYIAHNTKAQKWNRLVLDYYADKTACDEGYIYEDDTETTAYKLGKKRTTAYSASYCEKCKAYVLTIDKSVGEFDGDKCFSEREITVKRHLLGGGKSVRVTVNGKDVEIVGAKKDQGAFPLHTSHVAPDGDCELIKFTARADEQYEIKFYL